MMQYIYRVLIGALLVVAMASCQGSFSPQKEFDFDDSKTIVDVLQLPQMKSLSQDEAYKEYIQDTWDAHFQFYQRGPEMVKKIADFPKYTRAKGQKSKNDIQEDPYGVAKNMLDLGKWVVGGIWNSPGAIKDGLKIMMLQSKRDDLYAGFSDQKRDVAKRFEKDMNVIMAYSTDLFEQQINTTSKVRIVYRYLKPLLKEDDVAMRLIDSMLENADKFFLISMNVKAQAGINFLLSDKDAPPDNSQLVEYGISILNSDGEHGINLKSRLLTNYFKALNKLAKAIYQVENAKFAVPIEDWSAEKKASYEFSVSNIKELAQSEVLALMLK